MIWLTNPLVANERLAVKVVHIGLFSTKWPEPSQALRGLQAVARSMNKPSISAAMKPLLMSDV